MTAQLEHDDSKDDLEDGKMTLLDHLTELRNRLLYSVAGWLVICIICFALFSNAILNFLLEPLYLLLSGDPKLIEAGIRPRVIFTQLYEKFFAQIKAGFFAGTVLASPLLLGQIYAFIAPGLYKNEKRAFAPFLIASPVLFLMGMALVYYILIPFAWEFFLGTQQIGSDGKLDIQLEAKIGEYLSLVIQLFLAFGFCFQLPVAATLMARVGLLTSGAMRTARRYAIVAVFVVAAIVTPPDPISQLSLAIPIILLYELSIYLVKFIERDRPESEYDDDDDDEEWDEEEDFDDDEGNDKDDD